MPNYYKLKTLSVLGKRRAPYRIEDKDILTEDHFPRGNAEKLVESGHLIRCDKNGKAAEEKAPEVNTTEITPEEKAAEEKAPEVNTPEITPEVNQISMDDQLSVGTETDQVDKKTIELEKIKALTDQQIRDLDYDILDDYRMLFDLDISRKKEDIIKALIQLKSK